MLDLFPIFFNFWCKISVKVSLIKGMYKIRDNALGIRANADQISVSIRVNTDQISVWLLR